MRKYFNFLFSFSTVAYLAFFYVIDGIFLFSKGEGATRKVSVYGREAPKKMLAGGRGGCLKNVEGVVRGGMAFLKKLWINLEAEVHENN